MNKIKRLAAIVGFASCGTLVVALTGCETYERRQTYRGGYSQPPATEVSVGITIRSESDFYEPLSPYGRWEVVGSYGRCWIPARVEADWSPYSNGHWVRTDNGWYWESEEPWAWATYHYGRWDFHAQFGWYWVPQTQWAPAWVSWHHGGGYVGWAPLHPSARITRGVVEVNVRVIAPRAYVVVEERKFLAPVRPTTVITNNTTIINKTVNITNTKIVNNIVINEGPRTTVIEKASGQRVQAVPVRDLRRKQEAEVVTRQRIATPPVEKKVQPPPTRGEVEPRDRSAPPAQEPRRVEKPAATPPAERQVQPPARGQTDPRDRNTPPAQEPRRVEKPADAPPVERQVKPPVQERQVERPAPITRQPSAPAPKKNETEIERGKPVASPTQAKPGEVKRESKPETKIEKRGKQPERGEKEELEQDGPNKKQKSRRR